VGGEEGGREGGKEGAREGYEEGDEEGAGVGQSVAMYPNATYSMFTFSMREIACLIAKDAAVPFHCVKSKDEGIANTMHTSSRCSAGGEGAGVCFVG
jgi:hypothetical protein